MLNLGQPNLLKPIKLIGQRVAGKVFPLHHLMIRPRCKKNENAPYRKFDPVLQILKQLLVKQIESRVRWRENVNLMLENKITQFIEIGPGKVLSGLIKRIDKNVLTCSINNEEDIKKININD